SVRVVPPPMLTMSATHRTDKTAKTHGPYHCWLVEDHHQKYPTVPLVGPFLLGGARQIGIYI
ncbi:MAG TPA: hypothetical protein PKY22_11795, partial [Accumulibacter sp.]|nr:hypothetical protein [Accumulibacter sp.]